MHAVEPASTDALLIVDVQNDFLPDGQLPVSAGNEVIPVLNRYIDLFRRSSLPIYATRDWHPINHCSFISQGGSWPPHCLAGSKGAEFPPLLQLPADTVIVSKATTPKQEAYSGFEGTNLLNLLRSRGTERLFVGGLATDYCVLNTVVDALKQGFKVILLQDAIRAVDVHAGDGQKAIDAMIKAGAMSSWLSDIDIQAAMTA